MRFWISLFFLLSSLAADIDTLHRWTNSWIAKQLQALDRWLSDSNESIKQRFSVQSSIDTILETKKETRFRFNIRAHLELPRTQKKLHLFFQDYKPNENLDSQSARNVRSSIQNSSFLAGLSYLTSTNISYRAGVRFHKISPDPFLAAEWNDEKRVLDGWLYYGVRIGYYLDRKFDDLFFLNYQHTLGSRTLFAFENDIRYRQRPSSSLEFLHSLKLYHSLGRYTTLTPHIDLYALNDIQTSFKVNYYYVGADYRDIFYRKWLFYELSPAVLWRIENHFEPSYRLMVRFGITFERN